MLELVKTVGGFVSPMLVIITFLTMIIKPLRVKLIGWVKRTTKSDENEVWLVELRVAVQEIKNMMVVQCDAAQALLRDSICKLYYEYRSEKKLPLYEKENLIQLYDKYHNLKGNHFVDYLYTEMLKWDVGTDKEI